MEIIKINIPNIGMEILSKTCMESNFLLNNDHSNADKTKSVITVKVIDLRPLEYVFFILKRRINMITKGSIIKIVSIIVFAVLLNTILEFAIEENESLIRNNKDGLLVIILVPLL